LFNSLVFNIKEDLKKLTQLTSNITKVVLISLIKLMGANHSGPGEAYFQKRKEEEEFNNKIQEGIKESEKDMEKQNIKDMETKIEKETMKSLERQHDREGKITQACVHHNN
jgi:hypothetical protein